MRILYLSQLIPYPADAGPKIRIYRLLQYLVEAGHQVTLVAFHRKTDTEDAFEHLRQIGLIVHSVLMKRSKLRNSWDLTRSLLTNESFMINRDSVGAMYQLVASLLEGNRYDVIHADQLWMAQYGLVGSDPTMPARKPIRVLDQHNAVYLIPQRLAQETKNPIKRLLLRNESSKLARYETETCQRFDQVVWVTEEDRSAIDRVSNGYGSRLEDKVIPICVDPLETAPVKRKPGLKRVIFVGGMHWPPNAAGISWFTKNVWPLVLEKEPDAMLTIIGKDPPASLTGNGRANIELTGYVEDLSCYVEETSVFIVPLSAGGGMRVKILDAWCWGIPVVSTDIGAEGLRYVDQRDLLIANEPHDFANAIITLLDNPDLAERIATGGRRTVENHYDWRKIYPAWDEVYSTLS